MMDYYSLIKRNEVLIHATLWKANIMLHEGSQSQMTSLSYDPICMNVQNSMRSKFKLSRAGKEGKMDIWHTLQSDENVLKFRLDSSDGCTSL